MIRLSSFVQDQWTEGTGDTAVLVNPSTEEAVAETTTGGIDMAAALAHARTIGGPALRAMTFAQRGDLLKQMANALEILGGEILTVKLVLVALVPPWPDLVRSLDHCCYPRGPHDEPERIEASLTDL